MFEKIGEFFSKFFGYFQYLDDEGVLGNPEPYKDGLGAGAFSDWRHFAWMIGIIIVAVLFYQICKKHPKYGKVSLLVMAIALLATRTINQTFRACIGAEVPWTRAFPFHLCTISTFLVPICVIFKLDKVKPYAYVVGMMGGIITCIIGDYFDNSFMTFATIEGITAHNLLIMIPLTDIAIGGFKIEYKEIWKPALLTIIYILWATLANEVFFRAYESNYMYLKENALPGNIGGKYYFFIYIAIYIVMINLIYGIPTIYRKLKAKKA